MTDRQLFKGWQTGVAVGVGLAAGFAISEQLETSTKIVRLIVSPTAAGLIAWATAAFVGRISN